MPQILSVTELNQTIKKILEPSFASICVKGEVSNLKEQTSGHLYFTLKDQESQVSAVMFRGNTGQLGNRTLKNGDEIIVKGELSIYSPRGNYQIIVRTVDFAGIGELLLTLHERKKTLEARGWFNVARKRPLPRHPNVIGVITSPTGSVIQDILHVLNRRFTGFQLLLNPVKVQGAGAAEEIAAAIDQMNIHGLADVLIVGRGGGSLEDLWAFNEEIVAKAIFNSIIPVITAIGHETDMCIADYVADVRAPTPSAAAEIVMAEKLQKIEFLRTTKKHLQQILRLKIDAVKSHLRGLQRHPLLLSSIHLLGGNAQKIDECREECDQYMRQKLRELSLDLRHKKEILNGLNPSAMVITQQKKLAALQRVLDPLVSTLIRQKQEKFSQLLEHLLSLHPHTLLKKGYCILFRENSHSVIVSKSEVEKREIFDLLLQDGTIKVTAL
jgi:exodeoxyribonuclease VII large subunit